LFVEIVITFSFGKNIISSHDLTNEFCKVLGIGVGVFGKSSGTESGSPTHKFTVSERLLVTKYSERK
jgi:hypothetical protein